MSQTVLIRTDQPTSVQAVTLDRLNVSYGRVSLDELKLGKGVRSQHQENHDFGEEINLPIARDYEDVGISAFARKRERPGYQQLLEDIRAGLIAIVIVWHADRLTRDTVEAQEFIDLCLAHNVSLYSVQRGGVYNFRRAAGVGDFKRDIVKAEEESAHKGERVSLAHKRRALNGEWGGGVRPYGWGKDTGKIRSKCINAKADIEDRIYVDVPVLNMKEHREGEAKEIRLWADDLLAGVPMNQVLRDLAARKVPTPSEILGRQVIVKGRNVLTYQWARETIVGILTSPRVSGHAVWRGNVVAHNAFKPIIPEDKRQALITLFEDPSRRTSPGNTPKWLGTKIYRCGQCPDGLMRQRLKRQADKAPLYLCDSCNKGRQVATLLDEYISAVVVERLSRPDVIDLVAPADNGVDLEELRDEQAQLQQRKTGLALAFAGGSIDLAQLEAGTAQIDARLREVTRTLSESVISSPLTPFAVNHSNAQAVWDGLSLGRKREIVRLLIEVTVYQAPTRPPGRKIAGAPPEEIDPKTIRIRPIQ
ncbi:recombinase family protein [Streptomyces sp. SS7]|uniref:recombinase family protein n=1 Tax=Streptomyces sp. SS7 TaxID=3108485 RepID=UPI0030EEE3DD